MDFQVEIQLWEDALGFSPVEQYILGLPPEDQAWIASRVDYVERMLWTQILFSKYFEKVKGIRFSLWELKFVATGQRNYRLLSFPWKSQIVGVEMFAGSGSGGKVMKHVPIAIVRADDWMRRHP